MIKATIEVEETKANGIVALRLSIDSEKEQATKAEVVAMADFMRRLEEHPSSIGYGRGKTPEEANKNSWENSEIARAIIEAGRPITKGPEKEQ